jgi:hypothetical protein
MIRGVEKGAWGKVGKRERERETREERKERGDIPHPE